MSNPQNIPHPELWYRVYASGFIQRQSGKLWQQCSTGYLFVVFSFLFPSLLFSSNLAIPSHYSDHPPRVIGNENVRHSPSHPVSNGMWTPAPFAIRHIEYILPRLTAPTEIAMSNHINVDLQMNALPLPQSSQPIPPSHLSGDNTYHNIKYLEQLLDSSLATVAVIQFSGNTLADVLTPRAYDKIGRAHV